MAGGAAVVEVVAAGGKVVLARLGGAVVRGAGVVDVFVGGVARLTFAAAEVEVEVDVDVDVVAAALTDDVGVE
jgi:hypothetical protein